MQPLLKALAWTFVHSLWQGLLAALLVAVIISITRKTKARLRYNSLGMVFILFLTVVFITFILQYRETVSSSLVINITGNEALNSIANNSTEVITGGLIADLGTWFNNNTSLFLLVWTFFFLVNCMKLIAGLATVNRLRHYKTHPVSEEWKIKLEQLQYTLGISHSITLLQSELIKVPVAVGFLKPVILLPVGLLAGIPPEQVEAILLHELGHIRRRDYLVNFLQHFAEAIFFFNPAMLWISSLLRQEREACCDDIVVARIGQKRNYLNALVSFQEYTFVHSPYAVGISSRKQYLLGRVKRMITNENKKLNLLEKTALLAGVLLFSAFTYIAQEKEVKELPLSTPVEQFDNVQQANEQVPAKQISTEPGMQPTGKAKKKFNHSYKPVTDTVPEKDKAIPVISDPLSKKPVIEKLQDKTNPDANTVLEEIKQIKEQIGKKKESIGVKKGQLKEMKGNTKEEEALVDQIERERREIEAIRSELERKRALLESLKKQKEKQNEMKNEEKKTEVNYEKKIEKKNELKNEIKKNVDKTIETKFENRKLFQSRKTVLFQNREKPLFQNRRIKLIQNTSETKPAKIVVNTRADKMKLFKEKHIIKPEEKKDELKKTIPLKPEPPKPPAEKEKPKSPATPEMKNAAG
jgi:bla regulator protein BlaR1